LNREKNILERISAGDNTAFSYIYKEYFNALCSYAKNYFADSEEVKNVVQDVIMSLWENRTEAIRIKSLRSYLFKSVHYQCLNHIKHRKVIEKFNGEAAYNLKMIALETEDVIESNEQIKEIMDAIEQLPNQTKLVFKMKRFDEMSYKEIAEKLGISDRTVDTHMTKAMRKLKEILGHMLFFLILGYGIFSTLFTK